jgi:flagellar biosynthesis protein FlhB
MAATPKPFLTESSLKGPPAMEVLDEAVSLLRRTPLSVFSVYYLGALPFWLAFVYFYFDMTQSADADAHLPGEALLLTALYFWMKTCQAVFARKLLALLEGEDRESWDLPRLANTALLQTIYAGSLIIVYPLGLIITIPFGWVSAFYHNISIVATGPKSTVRSSLFEAAELSRLWPRQNHLILAILLAALLFLFINLAVFFSMVPELLNMFFGIATVFDENGSAWQNSSFYLDVLVLCFLVLNPLNKAVYVLRCFYGRARLNGADLKAELRRQDKIRHEQAPARVLAVLLVLCVALLSAPVRADTPAQPAPVTTATAPVAPANGNLDQAIQKTLQKDEFAWRLPREQADQPEKEGFIARMFDRFLTFLGHELDRLMKPLGKFLKWLFGGNHDHDSSTGALQALANIPWTFLFLVILALVVACLVFILVRNFRRRAVDPKAVLATVPVKTVDLEAETVRADALPEDSWLALARELMDRGELRLALRALYLATLSLLAQHQLVRLGPAKSNRDYLLELTRRLRDNAAAIQLVRDNINLFEASWYGTHAVNSIIIETMLANHQQVRGHATA